MTGYRAGRTKKGRHQREEEAVLTMIAAHRGENELQDGPFMRVLVSIEASDLKVGDDGLKNS